MRNLILISALLALSGCASVTSGDIADLSTTAYGLQNGMKEVGTASLCGPHPLNVIACSAGLKQGAKYALTRNGYTPKQAGHIISTAGWVGAGSNVAALAGVSFPQSLLVGVLAGVVYHESTGLHK